MVDTSGNLIIYLFIALNTFLLSYIDMRNINITVKTTLTVSPTQINPTGCVSGASG